MTKLSSNQNFSPKIFTLFQASITPSPCSCDTPWLQNRWHLKNVRILPRGSSKENSEEKQEGGRMQAEGTRKECGMSSLYFDAVVWNMRTPCPSTACGLQMNSCCIFDKLAYETINNMGNSHSMFAKTSFIHIYSCYIDSEFISFR